MKKIIEKTEELYIKFSDNELQELNLKSGDKFSWESVDGGFLLKKYVPVELDLADFSRDILEFLVKESIEKNISVEDVIENILTKELSKLDV